MAMNRIGLEKELGQDSVALCFSPQPQELQLQQMTTTSEDASGVLLLVFF